MERRTITLTPPLEDPPYLGGLPADGSNRIDPTSTYGQLRRARTLPQHSFTFHDETVELAFNCFWEGHFVADVRVNESCDADYLLALEATSGDDDSLPVNYAFAVGFSAHPIGFGHVQRGLGVNTPEQNGTVDLATRLKEEQSSALAWRMLHNFVRARGVELPWSTFEHAFQYMSSVYKTSNKFKLALDIQMVKSDIMINADMDNAMIGAHLPRVGEFLESLGRFEEAGTVYEETIEAYFTHDPSPEGRSAPFVEMFAEVSEHALVWKFAGLAYKRASQFQSSERAYVKALNCQRTYLGNGWDINEDTLADVRCNMFLLYDYWSARQTGNADAHYILCSFAGLLYSQDFRGFDQKHQRSDYIKVGSACLSKIQPQFRNREAASRVLEQATRSSSVSDFRDALLSTLLPEYTISASSRPPLDRAPTIEETRRRDKHFARNCVMSPGDESVAWASRCGNPSCRRMRSHSDASFKTCPCGTVAYCNQNCQKAHWREHRQLCSARPAAAVQSEASTRSSPRTELRRRDRVKIHGLQGATHLNGTYGALQKFHSTGANAGRWGVRCDEDGELRAIKPENLTKVL